MVKLELYYSVIDRVVGGKAREAADQAANITAQRAKANAPVDTGALRDSITTQAASSSQSLVYMATVYSPLEYAEYQEYGTRGSQARPGGVLVFKPKGSGTFVFAKKTGPVPATRFMQRARDMLSLRDFL